MLKKIKGYISELGNQPSDAENQEEKEKNIINNACAALLIETALADKVFNTEEIDSMKKTLREVYEIDEKDLDELISESEKKVSESTSLYEYTRLINDLCDYQDKLKLINNLWTIAFADKHLDKYEEFLIRKISDLLYVSHSDFIQQKLSVKESLL